MDLSAGARRNESYLTASALSIFRNADWKRLQMDLAMYAFYKVQRLKWRTAQGLPRGLQPEDLVLAAIQKTYEGLVSERATKSSSKGVRVWNPEKDPDLLEFLKSVIDSDVNSLVNLEEHKLTNYSATATAEEAAQILHSLVDKVSNVGSPEREIINLQERRQQQDLFETIIAKLRVLCAADEDESKVLAASIDLTQSDQSVKPARISRLTGLSDERVRNAKRRIERKTRALWEQIGEKKGMSDVHQKKRQA